MSAAKKKISIPPKSGRMSGDIGDKWVGLGQEKPVEPSEEMQRLALDIPARLHQAIKMRAVQERTTMAKLLRKVLEEKFPNEQK